MAKQYKDFNKETKDLLTKNFTPIGHWKIESKKKGNDGCFLVNPNADGKGVNLDVDYNCNAWNLKTKTNIDASGVAKPKFTYETKAIKAELQLQGLSADADYEATLEADYQGVKIFDKLTKKALEVQAAYNVGCFTVGGGVTFGLAKGFAYSGWTGGLRWSDKGAIVNVTTKNLKTFTTGVHFPLKCFDHNFKIAAQVDCGGDFKGTIGFDVPITAPTLFGFATGLSAADPLNFRARMDHTFSGQFSLIKKIANDWQIAVTSDPCCCGLKTGITLTRE